MAASGNTVPLVETCRILLALVLSGAMGGFVRAIVEETRTDNNVTLPFSRRVVALGCTGDTLIGACAAVVGYTFFNVLGSTSAPEVIKLIGFGIASGYAGARILNAMLEKFPQQKIDILASKQEAFRLFDAGKYPMAVRKFREILTMDPSDIQSKANLALSLSYTGEDGVKEALSLFDEVTQADPKNDEAWYNTACIRAIATFRKFTDQEVLEVLRKAIDVNADWKAYIKSDKDFNRFRQTPPLAEYQAISGDEATQPIA